MNNISSASRLSFFKVEKYNHCNHTFDTSCCPRPHFCMAFLLSGKAVFTDCTRRGEKFEVYPGEMVFVPVTTRYISNWTGDPDVDYISFHFLFDYPGIFNKNKNFKLQKLTFDDPEKLREVFERSAENYDASEELQLSVLSGFFGVLAEVLPRLETGSSTVLDSRISDAVDFIEQNYADHITVEDLARRANMSESRFYPCFKESLGVTPVDYINHYRVSKAIVLIVNREDMSLEEVSTSVGFESAAYFRRVFKKITGKNPRDYRRINAEI